MQEFSGFVSSIIGIVILCVIIENITPSGVYKKYVKFATGLIIMITVITAVARIFSVQYDFDFEKYTLKSTESELNENFNDSIKKIFSEKLSKEIEYSIKKDLGMDCRIRAYPNDDFSEIMLYADCSKNSFIFIKDYIKKTYEINDIVMSSEVDNNE